MHRKLIFLLVLGGLVPLSLLAQGKEYLHGYIITAAGDTLHGKVLDRKTGSFEELYEKIRFRPEGSKRTHKYGPSDIEGYRCGNQHFVSIPLREESSFFMFRYYVDYNDAPVFLKVVALHEKLHWYHREWVDGESNYIDYTPLFYKPGTGEMVRVTQGMLGLKRKALADYFRGCPELARAIEEKILNTPGEVFDFYTKDCQR